MINSIYFIFNNYVYNRSSHVGSYGEPHSRSYLSTVAESNFPRLNYKENEKMSRQDFADISVFATQLSTIIVSDVVNELQVLIHLVFIIIY